MTQSIYLTGVWKKCTQDYPVSLTKSTVFDKCLSVLQNIIPSLQKVCSAIFVQIRSLECWDIKNFVKTDKNGNFIIKCKKNFSDNESPFISIEHVLSINSKETFLQIFRYLSCTSARLRPSCWNRLQGDFGPFDFETFGHEFHHFGDVSRDSDAFWTPGVPECLRDLRVVNGAMLAEFIYPHGDRWLTGSCRESAAETVTESVRVSRFDQVLAEISTQTSFHLSVYRIIIDL